MTELLAGRYELIDTVGKGATGQVWQAFDTRLQRTVAIKLVEIEGARDPAMAERFNREGIAIAGLSHDTIVKVYDTGTDTRQGWLVMELLSGPNTNALVKQEGPVSYEVGLPLLAKVADGLQVAHQAGITHRDVKPANIVLDAPPALDGARPDLYAHPELARPVLVDFGIAHIVDEASAQLTRPATAIGTAAYMSPEQARGQIVGPASDVYSLACVAYHLLLGRPPFQAASSLAVAHAQAYDTPVSMAELDPGVPPALDALVKRMLAKDPAARPTAREVAGQLRAISANPTMTPLLPVAPLATGAPGPADPAATAVLDPNAVTAVLGEPATDLTSGADAQAALAPPAEASPPVPPPQSPHPAERGPFRHAGRWLVALLVIALLAALVYLWLARDDEPTPAPTVTMTHTETTTTGQPPTTHSSITTATTPPPVTESQITSDPLPTQTDQPAPTTTATAHTTVTEAPTQPETTAPPPVEPTDQPTEEPAPTG